MTRWDTIKKLFNADRTAALLIVILTLVYGWESTHFIASHKADVIGPGFFPNVLAVLGLVLGLLLFFGGSREEAGGGNAATRSDLAAMIPVALLLGYGMVIGLVGFPVATLGFLTVTFKYFGYPSWRGALVLSAIITAVFFCLFYLVLDLKLPLGMFAKLI